jgi:hypothetical protein
MVTLVTSNLAMAPGVIYCVACRLYAFAALLAAAAGASALYHLCDSDVYCFAGWSFRALQVPLSALPHRAPSLMPTRAILCHPTHHF